jgi:hypothetical protein
MHNYVLRATNFFYDDNYSFNSQYSHWRIHSRYDNLETATATHAKLEIEAMRQTEPYLFCDLHGGYSNYEATRKILSDYLKEELNLEVDDSERKCFQLPRSVTDNQVLEIKNILNVQFYKMIAFQDDIIFYKPIMNESFWGQEFASLDKGSIFEMEYKGYAFFNSKEDAILNIPKIVNYWIATYSQELKLDGLNGKIEELCEYPLELIEFLEKSENFKYNATDNKIELRSYGIDRDNIELTKLIDLLVKKPYELLSISYQEALTLGYLGKNYDDPGPYGNYYYYGEQGLYHI